MVEKNQQESGYGCLLTVVVILIFLIYLFIDYILNEDWYLLWLLNKDNLFLGIKFIGGYYGLIILISSIYYFAIFPIGSKIRTHINIRSLIKNEQIITTPELHDKCSPREKRRLKMEWANLRYSLGLDMDWVNRQEEINNNVGYTPTTLRECYQISFVEFKSEILDGWKTLAIFLPVWILIIFLFI